MLDFATDGRLSHTMAEPAVYPTTTFVWARQSSGATRALFAEVQVAAGRRVKQHALYSGSGSTVSATSLTSWGGAPDVGVATDLSAGAAPKAVMVVRHSASSVTIYTSTAPGGATNNDANALASEFANADTLLVGASYFDGAYSTFAAGALGEKARWHGVALNAGHFDALAGLTVAPVAPETIEPTFLYGVWDMNPAGAAGAPITGTLVDRVNGRVMTVTGTVTKSGVAHPVARTPAPTLSGGATLDSLAAGGGLTSVAPSTLSGSANLDSLTAAGTLGIAPGVLTSGVLKRNGGEIAAGVTLDWLTLLVDATGAFVATKNAVVTNGAGIFSVSDAGMLQGTVYRAVWREAGGQRGQGWAAAA
jgi:hypothetical protein